MLKIPLPPELAREFATMTQALRPVTRRPDLFDTALARWVRVEPALAGLRPDTVFAGRYGVLSDDQARALVRIARSQDEDVELATWALIYQFVPAITAVAKQATCQIALQLDEAVDTAITELYISIRRIDLESNEGSIFFALSKLMQKAVVRGHTTATDMRYIYKANEEWGSDEGDLKGFAIDEDETDRVDWELTIDRLTDFLADDLVDALGWDRGNRYFERRHARLRCFVAFRVAEATVGERPASAPKVAAALGESRDAIQHLQADVNRVWGRCSTSGTVGDPESFRAFLGQAA